MKDHRTGRSPMKTVLFTLAAVILIAAFAAGCAHTGAKVGDADRTEKAAPTSEQAETPEAASALPDTDTAELLRWTPKASLMRSTRIPFNIL